MSEFEDLEQRLGSYGDVLRDELAGWPAFVAPMTTGTPLQLLRRRLGRWLGAGHRPLFIALASCAALALAVMASLASGSSAQTGASAVVAGSTASDPAESTEDQPSETSDTSPTTQDNQQDQDLLAPQVSAPDPAADPDAGVGRVSPEDVPTPAHCSDGELVDSSCRIVRASLAPLVGAACVAQGGVDGGSAGCFLFVDAAQTCLEGVLQGEDCVADLGPATIERSCADGTIPTEGSCAIDAPAKRTCLGIEDADRCLVEAGVALGGEPICSAGSLSAEGDCVSLVAGVCVDGTRAASRCDVAAPIQQALRCPGGFNLIASVCQPAGGCIDTSTSKTVSDCSQPPIVERICSATGQPVADSGCFTSVAPVCPTGTESTGSGCQATIAATTLPFSCPDADERIGSVCFRVEPWNYACDQGSLDGDRCVQQLPPPGETRRCAVGTVASDRCVRVTPVAQVCERGVAALGGCAVELAIDRAALCPTGTLLEVDSCVVYVDPS